ncbi:MAG: thiamine pyrophosphate-binding protein [Lachnospiraceae bacterium]|nr:thiamine pyrophosphate-binding protein [Lachnospiraceae bacterium]
MKVSDYIVQQALACGIRDTFLVTGGGAMHLDDSFGHHSSMRCTYHHNEQACAMAAEAYARVENRPAAVLVTTGPGASNAITGVLCGWMESIPMLVISGQARFATTVRSTGLPLRSMGIQEFDITQSVACMTKYAVMIEKKDDVRYCVEKALHLMMSGRRGPVWLDVPLDVQSADIDPAALRGYDPEEDPAEQIPPVSDSDVNSILQHLKNAERPVLFGGFGVRAAGSVEEFRTLGALLGIPILTGMSSQDLVAEDHPLFAGRTGMTGSRAGNLTAAGCDLFLSIGSRMSFLQTGFDYEEWARGAYVILNEIDPAELQKPNVRSDLSVIGDAGELLRKLIAKLQAAGATKEKPYCEQASGWLSRSIARKKHFPLVSEHALSAQPDGLSNIYAFYDRLSDQLEEGAQILCAVGTSRVAGTQAFRLKENQRFYTNSATASMGYDLPAAIGLARALTVQQDPSVLEEVNVVTGDGSLMMNLQELQTIATNHLPVRIFLINNGGYHSIRQTQNAFFGKPLIGIGPESGDLEFPAPAGLASLFGLQHAECVKNETLEEDLAAALQLPLPALIEVRVSPLQKTEPKISSRRLEDGSMVSSPIEDMAPFLPREELAEYLEVPLTEHELQL